MKKLFFILPFILVASTVNVLLAQNVQEEKKETIILDDNGTSSKGTTIEIVNGDVFVDGKKVTEGVDGKNKNVKIIKKKVIINGKEVENSEQVVDDDANMEMPMMWDMASNRPMLGVSTKETETNEGALIEHVVPNSTASKMGLQPGDIITKVNDKNILTPKDLVEAISTCKIGQEVKITFERDHKFLMEKATLSEGNSMFSMERSFPFGEDIMKQFELLMSPDRMGAPMGGRSMGYPYQSKSPKLGIHVEDRADGNGVLVNEVNENSAADKAGILKNDVITLYNGTRIEQVDQLVEAIANAGNKESVDVEIQRNGQNKKLKIKIPKQLKKKEL
ncbi:MAG: PDZ domain-containing protein [Chitinophagaceae bacterium]